MLSILKERGVVKEVQLVVFKCEGTECRSPAHIKIFVLLIFFENCKIRIILPFKDQVAANAVRRQFHDLSNKIRPTLEPVFVSRKLENDLKPREVKPSIVNQQCVVYHFSCDLCDADYVGYTARHLFQRVAEHKNSAIGKHFLEVHGNKYLLNEGHFKILRKCQSKFDCLVFEMLFIKKIKPCLNTQADSIRAKLFV